MCVLFYMEKFLEYLQEAKKIIQTADHIVYITYPLVQDKKILIKVLLEIKKAMSNCINSVLQYEYLYKRITLYKNPRANLETFIRKSSSRYNITREEISLILKLFDLVKKREESTAEFLRGDKIVFLSENLKTETINIEKVKEFLVLAKKILKKILEKIDH